MRAGRWTKGEEEYAHVLMKNFDQGLLPIPNGIMLRVFLSEALNCDPMRISKKFAGHASIGKQVFARNHARLDAMTVQEIIENRKELALSETRFLAEDAQAESEKKNKPSPLHSLLNTFNTPTSPILGEKRPSTSDLLESMVEEWGNDVPIFTPKESCDWNDISPISVKKFKDSSNAKNEWIDILPLSPAKVFDIRRNSSLNIDTSFSNGLLSLNSNIPNEDPLCNIIATPVFISACESNSRNHFTHTNRRSSQNIDDLSNMTLMPEQWDEINELLSNDTVIKNKNQRMSWSQIIG